MHTLPLSLFAIVALLLPTTLQAQIRPGNTARTTVGGARTTGGAVSGARGSAGPRQYRSNTELGDAVIQIDQETRSLVIVTDESTHGELIKVIESLDRPKPQVLIKVVFLEVTYNNSLDLGVEASYTGNWGYGTGAVTGSRDETITETGTTRSGGVRDVVTSTSTDLSAAAILPNGISAENLFNLANATQGAFIRVLADDWTATVHALSTKGKVEVLSRPSIMARNNQEAVIVVGQEVPFITNSRITDNGQTINTVQYDNVGIILRVTPFITSDGAVEMIVAPEISTLTDQTVPISNTAS
jgi:general secretion pathway protein D